MGHLRIADDDVVDRSNLQRQILHTEARIGEPKVASAQATLAAGIEPIAPAALAAALAPLAPEAAAPAPEDRAAAGGVAPRLADAPRDPQGFLLAVMNDERVPLALRVDAAKALLAHAAAVR